MGTTLILLSSIITILFWLPLKNFNTLISDPLLNISQLLALTGLILMSWSLILSTKLNFIEYLFGGLDKSYSIHRTIGTIAFLMVLNHPLLLAIKSLPSFSAASIYLIPSGNLAYTLGILGFYTIIFSFIFIAFIKLPYHIWKFTHKLLGVGFMLGGIHSLLIGSDMAASIVLRTWIVIFIVLGSISAFYTLVLYRKVGQKVEYILEKIERQLDVINLYLTPKRFRLVYRPGQFVYLSASPKSDISDELHPFSVSSHPSNPYLRLSVKTLGDYTLKLNQLKLGEPVTVYGPHGTFGQVKNYSQNEVWIAGGIGVTPFLSMIPSLFNSSKNVVLFYSVRNQEEAVFSPEIKQATRNLTNFRLIEWFSETSGRINAINIKDQIKNISNTNFLICGPVPMMNSLSQQLQNLEVKENQIFFENFSLDSI